MKLGGGLGSEGTLSSVLCVWACSRVLLYFLVGWTVIKNSHSMFTD